MLNWLCNVIKFSNNQLFINTLTVLYIDIIFTVIFKSKYYNDL